MPELSDKGTTVMKDDGTVDNQASNKTVVQDDESLELLQNAETEQGLGDAAVVEEVAEEPAPTDEIAALKARLDQLEEENQALKSKPAEPQETQKKERTWEDLSVDELKVYRNKFRSEDDHAKADAINDIILEKIKTDAVTQVQRDQDFHSQRAKAWNETTQKYADLAASDPDLSLSDKNSALFKAADTIYISNPQLKSLPNGETIAVEMAAATLLSRKYGETRKSVNGAKGALDKERNKTALEGAGRASVQTTSVNRLMAEANKYTPGSEPHKRAWQNVMKEINKQGK